MIEFQYSPFEAMVKNRLLGVRCEHPVYRFFSIGSNRRSIDISQSTPTAHDSSIWREILGGEWIGDGEGDESEKSGSDLDGGGAAHSGSSQLERSHMKFKTETVNFDVLFRHIFNFKGCS